MDIWVVPQPDGTDLNILTRQWFWFRVDRPTVPLDGLGPSSSEKPLNALDADPLVLASDTDEDGVDDNLRLRYDGAGEGLTIEVNYHLMAGTPGSGRADIAETIRLVNIAGGPLVVHFFRFSDFNLSAGEDGTAIPWPNTADVWFADVRMSETVVTPRPTACAVGLASDLLASLQDGLPTVLDGSTGPVHGDTAWVFEWAVTLDPGAAYLISKDKSMTPTPEPATLALLALGAAGLAVRRAAAGTGSRWGSRAASVSPAAP